MANTSFERASEENKNPSSTASSQSPSSPPTPTPGPSPALKVIDTDPALDQPAVPTDPMLQTQYQPRALMAPQYYHQQQSAPTTLPLPFAPEPIHRNRHHQQSNSGATHQQPQLSNVGEDSSERDHNAYARSPNTSPHLSGAVRLSRSNASVDAAAAAVPAELDPETQRRSLAYASAGMPTAALPFPSSGQLDPRLAAAQLSGSPPPSNAGPGAAYLNGHNHHDIATTLDDSNSHPLAPASASSSSSTSSGNKRKRVNDDFGPSSSPSSSSPHHHPHHLMANSSPSSLPYPPATKMRLSNNGNTRVKHRQAPKAAVIEAYADAEAANQAYVDSLGASTSNNAMGLNGHHNSLRASGSPHAGSSGDEGGDDTEGTAGGLDMDPTASPSSVHNHAHLMNPQNPHAMDMSTTTDGSSVSQAGLLQAGADGQELHPDGSITVHGIRLPPIMQVEKQHVTTQATKNASRVRRRNEAVFHCPVPGCDSSFTRKFNLRGHMRSHTEEKPFECDWAGCDKAFARKHDLNRHRALHTATPGRHQCSGCGKSFSRTDALNRHLRSEGGAACKRASAAAARAEEDAMTMEQQQQSTQAAQVAAAAAAANMMAANGMYPTMMPYGPLPTHPSHGGMADYAQHQGQGEASSHAGSRSPGTADAAHMVM